MLLWAGDDDEDLYASLARTRKAAEKQMQAGTATQQDSLAEQLASRRDQDDAQQAMDTENDTPAGNANSKGRSLLVEATCMQQCQVHLC